MAHEIQSTDSLETLTRPGCIEHHRGGGKHPVRLLLAGLLAALLLGALMPAVPAAAQEERSVSPQWRQEMLDEVNALRVAHGRSRLAACSSLDNAAQGHVNYLRDNNLFTHIGAGGTTWVDRIMAAGYAPILSGENLAAGTLTVSATMSALSASSTHRANLLEPRFRHFGAGFASGGAFGTYWSQNFGEGLCADPRGALDSVTAGPATIRLVGWAIDLNAGTAPIDVRFDLNGIPAEIVTASLPRPDVDTAYPGYGPNHGFDHTIAVAPGNQTACAVALNVGLGVDVRLGCRTVWVPDPASPFFDLLSSNPFFDDIMWLVDNNIASGYADGSFRASASVTRQAMAAFLWRLNGAPDGPFDDPGFTDVPANHPFRTPIAWMATEGLANGFNDGSFQPTATVSRQAATAFLWRLAQSPDVQSTSEFTDVGRDHQFFAPITWASHAGIAQGDPGGTFRPGDPVSRQASAAFLRRFHTNVGLS